MPTGYIPPAQAFGAGLERGIRLDAFMQAEQDRRETRDFEKKKRERDWGREEETHAETVRQRERTARDYDWKEGERQYKLYGDEVAGAQGALSSLLAQYGGDESKVPPDQLAKAKGAMHEANTRYLGQRKAMLPKLEQRRQQALDEMKQGNVTAQNLSLTARRPASDFLRTVGPDGVAKPSPVEQAHDAFMQAMDTGDTNQMLASANFLLKPELSVGVGERQADGTTITSKEIIGFAPSPDGKGLLPVLRVKAKRDDGATRQYVAGVTKGRSSADGDPYVTLDMDEAFKRLGNLRTMAEVANAPGVAEKVRAETPEERASTQSALQLLYASGHKPPDLHIKTEKTDLGGTVERETTIGGIRAGTETKEKTIPPGIRFQQEQATERAKLYPRTGGGSGSLRNDIAGIKQAVADGDITEEEGDRLIHSLLRKKAEPTPKAPPKDTTGTDRRLKHESMYGKDATTRSKGSPDLPEFDLMERYGLPPPKPGAMKSIKGEKGSDAEREEVKKGGAGWYRRKGGGLIYHDGSAAKAVD